MDNHTYIKQALENLIESAKSLGAMDAIRDFIEGMSVSVDVSTGEHDIGHRYFGTVTEVMDNPEDKHGVTLLVQDAEPNFEQKLVGQEPDWKDQYQKLKRRADMWIAKYEQDICKLEMVVPIGMQQQTDQTPVGFVRQIDIDHLARTPSDWGSMFGQPTGYNTVPVFLHPPVNLKRLPDEQIDCIESTILINGGDFKDVYRAIEQAHDIF